MLLGGKANLFFVQPLNQTILVLLSVTVISLVFRDKSESESFTGKPVTQS